MPWMFRAQSLFLPLALWTTSSAQAVPPPVVAVFELRDAQGRLTPAERSQLTRYVRVKLTELGSFPVVPEAELKRALTEQQAESYQQCYDEACQIEVGREVAAQKSLALELVSVGERCILTMTMYDLSKATSERAASAETPCDASALALAADGLVRKMSGHSEVQAAAPPAADVIRLRVQTTDADRVFEVSLFDAGGQERRCVPALRAAEVCQLGGARLGRAALTVRVPEVAVTEATLDFDVNHTEAVVEVGVGRSWWAYATWGLGGSMAVGGLMSMALGAGKSADSASSALKTGVTLSIVGAAVIVGGFFIPRTIELDEHLLESD